ncbi:response regulator transcription factor [Thermatribacter velox]|uniref:Response regulator transcription factor n=1 Tax=Thermatribacter velox TaxID=3039681 RepID=A0ABZ2YD72_9BACT
MRAAAEVCKKEEVKVFLIDDNRFLLESLQFLIENQPGMKVVGKSTRGKGVLNLLHKLRPDVIVLDVRLQDTDGLTLLEELKKNLPVPVIMLSMYEEYRDEALRRGAYAYLVKGRDANELYNMLREASQKVDYQE